MESQAIFQAETQAKKLSIESVSRAKYISPPHPTAFRQSLKLTKIPQHTMTRPWTEEYWKRESPWKRKHNTMAEPIREEDWMWFKGDRVEILAGKDKGKQGYINFVVQVSRDTMQLTLHKHYTGWSILSRTWV